MVEFIPYGSKDLKQIFTNFTTYVILSFGFLVFMFVLFLAGWEGIAKAWDWAMQSDDGLFILLSPVAIYFGGLVAIVLGFHEYEEYNLILNTPTSTIRSIPMGRVEVKGTTEPLSDEHEMTSPFGGESCVGYECKVEEYHHDDEGDDWKTVYSNRRAHPFLLEDETGQVLVESEKAEWGISGYDYREKFREEDAPERVRQFISEKVDPNKTLDMDLFGGDLMRFSERRIDTDEVLYVQGKAEPADLQQDLPDVSVDNVIRKDDHTGFFYVSDQSEENLLSRKWWGVISLIGVGSILTPGGLVAIGYLLGIL